VAYSLSTVGGGKFLFRVNQSVMQYFQLENKEKPWLEVIRRQTKPMICLNDGPLTEEEFQQTKVTSPGSVPNYSPLKKSAFEV
jgi:hypothetical protein